jgi:Mg2+ and Co2+ transporter CorA
VLDVTKRGIFKNVDKLIMTDGDNAHLGGEWDRFKDHNQTSAVRVRALFVENMSGPVLRMLGAKYNIEPFFFSSSLNFIPSRFQEDARKGIGDHITITLPFIQVIPTEILLNQGFQASPETLVSTGEDPMVTKVIDTQAPLKIQLKRFDLDDGPIVKRALVSDLLSVHLVRNVNGNTIISYHANVDLPTTKANYLHERIRFAGQSVYWQKMLERAEDPTFLLLIFIWQAAYAWDEALQQLNEYICELEIEVMQTSSIVLTQQLHIIQAHLLYYSSLLRSFKKAVQFVHNTPNPALTEAQRDVCKPLMERECKTLLRKVERLNAERLMQEGRLSNVLNLVFSSVNIYDSTISKTMAEATLIDSEAMKQIAYLTMIILPPYFCTAVYSMNLKSLNPISNPTVTTFFEVTIPLTVVTIWIIVALQSEYMFKKPSLRHRIAWPYYLVQYLFKRTRDRKRDNGKVEVNAPLYERPTPYYKVL